MTASRKYRILREASVSESPASEIADAVHHLADMVELLQRAVCCLAVKQESRNPGEQRELGAILSIDVVDNFKDVPVGEEMRLFLAGLLGIDKRSIPKRPYGR
jgi:hypothetical protein